MKLVVGYGLAYYMLKAGWDMKYVVAGAISGVTIGTVLSALYLSIKARAACPGSNVRSGGRRSVTPPGR